VVDPFGEQSDVGLELAEDVGELAAVFGRRTAKPGVEIGGGRRPAERGGGQAGILLRQPDQRGGAGAR
jgi:hypothetical protein